MENQKDVHVKCRFEGKIRVRSLESLQSNITEGGKSQEDKEDIIILLSDSEEANGNENITPTPAARRRRRKKNIKMEVESVLSVSSTQSGKTSRKAQKFEKVASKCYKLEDYFEKVSKDEHSQNIQKLFEETTRDTTEEKKIPEEKGKKTNDPWDAPLRQYSATRAKNPVTSIFIRRKLTRSTNLKTFGQRHLTNHQKRIQNYFSVHRGSTFRSYYDTFKESMFPVMISGDENVNNFMSRLVETTATNQELFDFSMKHGQLVVNPKKGCSIDDEMHLLDLLDQTIKEEDEFDLDVNPECDENTPKNDDIPAEDTSNGIQDVSQVSDDEKVEEKEPPKRGKPGRKRKVICPPFKIIKGTSFAVDAFRYGIIDKVTHYFLTHFHADHYVGLKKTFNKPLYLTTVTANLVKKFINVNPKYLHEMTINVPVMIDGIEVIAMDANHCPGAAMFFFKLPSGECILHTGDFRASHYMEMEPIFWNHHIDTIYLDTTYLSSQTILPSQEQSIQMALDVTETFLTKNIGNKNLIIVGTYIVGKEKVWRTLAEHFNLRVWLEPERRRAVECMEDSNLLSLLCNDPRTAGIHVLPLGQLSYDYVVKYLTQFEEEFTHALALRPSGWQVNSRPRHQGNISLVGITYSEHSSYIELRRFVRYLRPHHVIRTVNAENMNDNEKIPKKWLCRSLKPWPDKQQSTITGYFPLRLTVNRKPRPVNDSGEPVNLSQVSQVAVCDPTDLVSISSTDWMI
ncbi:DNA cross-link repair 1A protein [Sergentomyia squamirostris]